MCGIIGFVHFPDAHERARTGLAAIPYRGSDATNVVTDGEVTLGHNLHAVINHVPQPLVSKKGLLVINCEIYNWKALARKHRLRVKNDAQLALALLDKATPRTLQKIIASFDGDFALAYYSKKRKTLLLARDRAGVKPLVYYFDDTTGKFAFASEKKALNATGLQAAHLNPRKMLSYSLETKRVSFADCGALSIRVPAKPLPRLKTIFTDAVKKRNPHRPFALLLSGGLDSALIGAALRKARAPFECFFTHLDDAAITAMPADLLYAKQVAAVLGKKLHIAKVSLAQLEGALPRIIELSESTDPVRIGVAATLYFATQGIAKKKIKVVLSGLGADELFAGYHRFKSATDINKDAQSYFIKLYENDLYYQDIICMANNLELRVPFLDETLAAFALALPAKYKIAQTPHGLQNKLILRDLAGEYELPHVLRFRPKKAMQYGSNFDRALEVLARRHGFASKAAYLVSLPPAHAKTLSQRNIPIAALLSTGKDSLYALHLMEKQGYAVRCLIAVHSKNPDSFLFHTPTIALARLQAKALDRRLILVTTPGEKEHEVRELRKGLAVAKHMFGIEGVVSGALYSNYQRERIERVCEDLGIRHFAPLWHHDQRAHLARLAREGYTAIISKIACYGLSEKWLGRALDAKAGAELEALHTKYGINVAGEGGEYESLVLDAPLFGKKLAVTFSKKMQNEFTGELIIKDAKLVAKR